MKVFKNYKEDSNYSYSDYLKYINESINKGTEVFKENSNSYEYLLGITDKEEQEKIMRLFNMIDDTYASNPQKYIEKYRINYCLSLGLLFHDCKDYIAGLADKYLYALLMGEYGIVNEENKALLPIFSNRRLLDALIEYPNNTKTKGVLGIKDGFFMVEQHIRKMPFDINDEDSKMTFINDMCARVQNDTLNDGVETMIEHWNSKGIIDGMRRLSAS